MTTEFSVSKTQISDAIRLSLKTKFNQEAAEAAVIKVFDNPEGGETDHPAHGTSTTYIASVSDLPMGGRQKYSTSEVADMIVTFLNASDNGINVSRAYPKITTEWQGYGMNERQIKVFKGFTAHGQYL